MLKLQYQLEEFYVLLKSCAYGMKHFFVKNCCLTLWHSLLSSKQHVLCKLQLDDNRSHQRSISDYALLSLVNTLYEWWDILVSCNSGQVCNNGEEYASCKNLPPLRSIKSPYFSPQEVYWISLLHFMISK